MTTSQPVTLMRPKGARPSAGPVTGGLPPDLLEEARGRARLLALLIGIAFSVDLLLFGVEWLGATVSGDALPPETLATAPFHWVNLGALLISMVVFRLTRSKTFPTARMLAILLTYQVLICFAIAVATNWRYYIDNGLLPNLTWVPAVVLLFPLVMPASPRKILWGSIAAGASAPLALLSLDLLGKVVADGEAYGRATVSSALAVFMAYMGARLVYGLGRQVQEARRLGSYRLETRLGEGGMGEVWRAHHRLLARPAAVKVIRTAYFEGLGPHAADEVRKRFEREAQVTATLRSPHTVTLFDFGTADDGSFYYVMELLDGLDTEALVRRFGPMPWERVVHVTRQICHSLSEAHGLGLVHRDIKPANIFLCRYGEDFDFVKVLDFGLVKTRDVTSQEEPEVTQEEVIRGTPGYVAPEQALGRPDIDARADIYAVGCVAYWLLTGQRVFSAETSMEMITHHARTTPVAPSQRTELEVPRELDRLVLACLAKNPADRPAAAKILSNRLASLEAAHAESVWTAERGRSWWDVHQPTPGTGEATNAVREP